MHIVDPTAGLAASVGRDWTPPTVIRALRDFRKVPLSHGRHHGGRLVVGPSRTSLRVESHEEACVARTLAARPDFSHIASQPLTIWFTWQGQSRRYTPDFEVHLKTPADVGRGVRAERFIVEVKPSSWQMRDDALWAARAAAVGAVCAMPLIVLNRDTARRLR